MKSKRDWSMKIEQDSLPPYISVVLPSFSSEGSVKKKKKVLQLLKDEKIVPDINVFERVSFLKSNVSGRKAHVTATHDHHAFRPQDYIMLK